MAIYLMKHPQRSAELLKYAEIVRMAAIQFPGFGWRRYDEQFRLGQESNPSRSWGCLDSELWITVAAAPVLMASQGGTSVAFAATGPRGQKKGYCFGFNGRRGCHFRVCKCMHKCSKCNAFGHGATFCRSGFQSKSPGSRYTGQAKSLAKTDQVNTEGKHPLSNGAQASGSSFPGGKSFRASNAN